MYNKIYIVTENKKKRENMEIIIFTLISIYKMVYEWNSQLAKAS